MKKDDGFVTGAILAFIGLWLILQGQIKDGFLVTGIGVAIMAGTKQSFRDKLFDFFLSTVRELWNILITR